MVCWIDWSWSQNRIRTTARNREMWNNAENDYSSPLMINCSSSSLEWIPYEYLNHHDCWKPCNKMLVVNCEPFEFLICRTTILEKYMQGGPEKLLLQTAKLLLEWGTSSNLQGFSYCKYFRKSFVVLLIMKTHLKPNKLWRIYLRY